jgi:hypothetical protein
MFTLRSVYTCDTIIQKQEEIVKTILLSFADDKERDEFLATIKGITDESVQTALNTVQLDPPMKADHERQCALFITGQKLVEGSLIDMNQRFEQEIAVHSGSVIIKELRGGEWHEIRSRKSQMV